MLKQNLDSKMCLLVHFSLTCFSVFGCRVVGYRKKKIGIDVYIKKNETVLLHDVWQNTVMAK